MTADIAAAKSALKHLEIDENPVSLRAKSRDFFWYSPVLKARLDHVVGDFAVAPNSEAEVIKILKACYAANREECRRKAYLRALPTIKEPRAKTLMSHGLADRAEARSLPRLGGWTPLPQPQTRWE